MSRADSCRVAGKDGDESERSQAGDLGLKIDIKATDETAGIRIGGSEASEIPAAEKKNLSVQNSKQNQDKCIEGRTAQRKTCSA